jgi:tRNA-specific 2-thiouridylase
MGKGKVLIAMSGGIDSAMAALLLHEQGYDLVGITMKTWDYATSGGSKKETGCCSLDSINDARNLAVNLGFPHYIVDVRDEFESFIISNFVDEYLAGRTPNPCILCNTHIKWDSLLRRADKLGCEFIATGHYAKMKQENGRFYITKGNDETKDQSYVLWGVSQESLSRTLFPLGEMQKSEVKALAAAKGYNEFVKKSESYEICFVPDNDYRGFLKRRVTDLAERLKGGSFITPDGTVVGQHEGYPFYTIGQRKGLNIALGYPAYVTEIRPETNTVVLGHVEDLNSREMWVTRFTLSKYAQINGLMEVRTKIRAHSKPTLSRIEQFGDRIRVEFYEDVSAITSGQSAVFFEGDDLIGGGFIE